VDELPDALNSAIYEACPSQEVNGRFRSVPWWKEELSDLKKETRELYRLWQNNRTFDSWNRYCVCRNNYRTVVRRSKAEAWQRHC